MRKVIGIASVFIMMLSVAAFANQFVVEESVLAAGAVDVEECGDVSLEYVITPAGIGEDLDTPDGNVTNVVVKGGDNCRYDENARGTGSTELAAPRVEVQLYNGTTVIDTGDRPFLAADETGGAGTNVPMDGAPQRVKVTEVDGVNIRIYDRN